LPLWIVSIPIIWGTLSERIIAQIALAGRVVIDSGVIG
jgi:hypothetical protein